MPSHREPMGFSSKGWRDDDQKYTTNQLGRRPEDGRRLSSIAIHIHGGDKVTGEGRDYRVPKRDLAGTLQSLLQSGRLKVAAQLELGEVFVKELLAFKVKVNITTGHDSYEALREGDHDDLVLAVAMPCWFATHGAAAVHRNFDNLAI